MGMSAQQPGKQNGQRRRGQRMAPMSEINVTPLVDVMLVLLIVFMVAAPLLTVGVPVDLPKTRSAPLSGDDEPLTITVNGDGAIFLQETEVQVEDLVPRLLAIGENGYEQRIYVRADQNINYGRVMDVMGTISSAGFARVGLVTETPTRAPQKR
ncbi:biopolymer transport TolR [Tepidicaulis marinus]|jgi:biopolymer transport protein TolR|uniref:Biopolymer transport TolR n=1 Tax=Tepidicaulis marinus TaxID=1333998 RepID=A0A081BEU2_9HYPH|nr:biopolymer transport TolR [Tepidicaulis marinus]